MARSPAGLRHDRSALALIEFAMALPIFLVMGLGGAELANYVTTKMRVSQAALHLADHAARMGTGTLLAAKTINETQINDVLTGAGLQAGELDLYTNGRVILTNIEPVADPNPDNRYKVTWQRCRGSQSLPLEYTTGQTNIQGGVGPTDRKVGAPNGSATIYVKIFYRYKPLFLQSFVAGLGPITDTASMTIRERRDLTVPIPNPDNVPVSSCI
jgi:hypothetical protein